MPDDFLHALLDTHLTSWRTNPETKSKRPFVIIKIVPFNKEWKVPEYKEPIKVKVIKKTKCKIAKIRQVEGKPPIVLKNRYEVLQDVSVETIWPKGNELCHVEALPDAKPDTYTIIEKRYGSIKKTDVLIYDQHLNEGSMLISPENPNFETDFPDIGESIKHIIKKTPVIVNKFSDIDQRIILEKGEQEIFNVKYNYTNCPLMVKSLHQLTEKDKPVVIMELEVIKASLSTVSQQIGPAASIMIANISQFVELLYEKYKPAWMRPKPIHEFNDKIFVKSKEQTGIYTQVFYKY